MRPYPIPVETVFETNAVRLWHGNDDDIAVLSFKSKMHSIGDEVLEGTLEAVRTAEQRSKALVIWHPAPFSAGGGSESSCRVAGRWW